jgi:hypothetical protein
MGIGHNDASFSNAMKTVPRALENGEVSRSFSDLAILAR